ncbi:MAG: hypothetical protein QXW39_05985, partial [Candidatus Bathyarchaeia archaeon]
MASLTGLAYQGFWWLSNILAKILYGGNISKLKDTLEAAGIRVYPQAYLSLISLFLIISIAASTLIIWFTGFLPIVFLPILVLLIGYAMPSIKAQDRAS